MRLELKKVSKQFSSLRGRVAAVKEVDLEVAPGELFVLLGPSGSGKSTILNLIAGLERPSGGEIWFDQRLVASPAKKVFTSPRGRNVAMVFQSYALYPHLSVRENIAFPLRVSGLKGPKVAGAVQAAAEMLAIEDLLAARPAELSGGQRQRVAIARAVVRRPDVFLLDEPLSNLDAVLRAATRAELKNLQRRLGVTTIYVTHDQIEALTLGDEVALLNQGRLEQVGTPDELYERPASPFAAAFVGSPPMNLLEASWLEEGGGVMIRLGDGVIAAPEAAAAALKRSSGPRFKLGLRPEDVTLAPAKGFEGRIAAIEPLGRERLVHLRVGGVDLTALSSDKGLQEGQKIFVSFNPQKIHVFA